MNEIGQKILDKIKEAHIKPKPKWEFLLKDYVFWFIFVVGIIIGSLAVSVVIFMLNHTDWQYYIVPGSPIQELLIDLPTFWLAILIIFLLVAIYNIKHTKKGYRYNPLFIVLGSIIVSIVIGSGVYAIGGAEQLEDIFYQRFPIYHQIVNQRGRFFSDPDRGRLAGVIVEVTPNTIIVQDFNGRIWQIATSTDQFRPGQRVRLLGQQISEQDFNGQAIRPWFKPNRPPLILMRMMVPN